MLKKKAMKGITAVLLLVFSTGILAGCSEPQSNEADDPTLSAAELAQREQQMDESDLKKLC